MKTGLKHLQPYFLLPVLLSIISPGISTALHAQGTAFTYQGRLNNNGAPAAGLYDFRFRLAADNQGDTYIGEPYLTNAITVTNGLFTTTVDFGAGIFTGTNYWLEVDVRTNNPANTLGYSDLTPLQTLTAAPYAVFAGSANAVSGAVPAAQLSGPVASANLTGTYGNAMTLNNAANSFTGNGTGLTNVNATALNGFNATNFWQTGGNHGTAAGVNYLGTSDNQPLELHANGARALRLEPGETSSYLTNEAGTSATNVGGPNVIGGAMWNSVAAGSVGCVIGGGGATNWDGYILLNSIGNYSDFSVIGGGNANTIQTNSIGASISGGGGNTIQANSEDTTISGGYVNTIQANSTDATISGGYDNTIQTNASDSSIGGGYLNVIQVNAPYSSIGGGYDNNINGDAVYLGSSTIAGGNGNAIQSSAPYSFIGGGENNSIRGDIYDDGSSAIAGGDGNTILTNSPGAFIGGGVANTIAVNGQRSFIGGGYGNTIQTNALFCFIGGGDLNTINGDENDFGNSVIAGGYGNTIQINANYSFMGGGLNNTIYGDNNDEGTSVIAGGDSDTVYPGSENSVIGGGQNDSIGTNSDHAFIGGGYNNAILNNDYEAVISGGYNDTNGGAYATLSGGENNVISGEYAVIPGGRNNLVTGTGSFVAGQSAQANNSGSFVWSDGSTTTASTASDSVTFRASGGYRFFTGSGTGGASLAAGATSWTTISDRNAKKDFAPVNYQSVLDKLAGVPIEQWHYKWENNSDTLNIGPMAQDFIHAFYPGRDDKGITTLEFDGVELAAIQGLNQKLTAELNRQSAENSELKARLDKMEKILSSLSDKQ